MSNKTKVAHKIPQDKFSKDETLLIQHATILTQKNEIKKLKKETGELE